jgi:hypothetical protein
MGVYKLLVVGGRRLLYFVHVWLCYSWRKKRRPACTLLLLLIPAQHALTHAKARFLVSTPVRTSNGLLIESDTYWHMECNLVEIEKRLDKTGHLPLSLKEIYSDCSSRNTFGTLPSPALCLTVALLSSASTKRSSRIWNSHSGGYEEYYLLGYNAV